MTNRSRSLLGHSTLVIVTFVLMLAGLVLISHGDDSFANVASAQVGSHLQIAPASNPTNWSDSTGPAWGFGNGAPGDATSGYVMLRSVDVTHPGTTSLTMSTTISNGATAGFAQQIFVTSMTLGGANLLPLWSNCAGTGGLTLAQLASCSPLPAMPIPPADSGAAFAMTFQFNSAAGNPFQGATADARFFFTLTDTTANPPPSVIIPQSPTATPTGTPSATATPSPTATPTASPTVQPAAKIIAIADLTPPLDATQFTLAIAGPGGVSGPGPQQSASVTGIGTPYLVSMAAPSGLNYNVVLDSVTCVSDARANLNVAQSFAVNVTPQSGETITCTFKAHGEAILGETGPGNNGGQPSATPIAPFTGSGSATGHNLGVGFLVAGVLMLAAWLLIMFAFARRRKTGEE